MKRHSLTDSQWEQLAPLLPPAKPRTGRPNLDHRRILDGILWRLTTGAPWRDVPATYGPWQTLYSVCHGPYVAGTSRQGAPVVRRQRMPSRMRRWSRLGRPVRGLAGGSRGASCSHWLSVRE